MSDRSSMPVKAAKQMIEVPKPDLPAGVTLGIYANQMAQISNNSETIIDFSLAVPSKYDITDETLAVELHHEVVARLIVPKHVFLEFVNMFIIRNADELGLTLTEVSDNEVAHSTSEDGE